MAFEIYNEYLLSGGASNADQTLSIGGVKSSVEVPFPIVTWDSTTITGITLVGAVPNVWGVGAIADIEWYPSADYIYMRYTGAESSELSSYQIDEPVDGRYMLPFKDIPTDTTDIVPGVIIDVVRASLPVSSTSENGVTLSAPLTEQLFSDVSESISSTGATEYRCIYITNTDSISHDITFWLEESSNVATYSLGLSNIAAGSYEPLLTDENDTATLELETMTWSTGGDMKGGVTMTIPSGSYKGIWIRRVIQPLNIITAIDEMIIKSVVL